jgi:phenylpropionate dioxygenase-like ring-hydroxylating dioxygenase large terminal subunit
VFNRRDGGMQALVPIKWLDPVNWKTLVDNCSDNYHVPTSHLSSARVQTRRYAAGGRRRARTAAGEGDHVAGRYEVARVPRFYRRCHDDHAGASVMLAAKAARGLDLISS